MGPILLELAGSVGGSQTLLINCWSQVEQSYECLDFANLIQPGRGRGQSWPWIGDIDGTVWGLRT